MMPIRLCRAAGILDQRDCPILAANENHRMPLLPERLQPIFRERLQERRIVRGSELQKPLKR